MFQAAFQTVKVAALLATVTAAAFAQSETGKATLEGRVLDPSSTAVSRIDVTAIATQTGIRRKATSDAEGKFRLPSLQVGTYEVEAVGTGFSPTRVAGVELLVGQTRSVNITFRFGDRMRLDFSAEGFNLTRASNKSFNGDGETSSGKPQAAVNPLTGYSYTNNNAGITTFAPGTDRFGGPRQGQLGVRFHF